MVTELCTPCSSSLLCLGGWICCGVTADLRLLAVSQPRQEHRHGLPRWLPSPLQHLSHLSLTIGRAGIRKQGQKLGNQESWFCPSLFYR